MRSFLAGIFFLTFTSGFAQQDSVVLTLDDCIETALERNIQLKQARNNEIIAESNRFQSIMNFFPSVSAGVNYDFFFGNYFDTNAARQVSETTNSSNPNLSSNMVLFNGFSNHYRVQQRKQELIAATENTRGTKLTVEGNVLGFYLNVILDKENIKIAQERVDLLEAQLEREKKRQSVGVGNLEDVYNFQGQLANQKLTLNNMQNTLKIDLLTLFQAMQLDPNEASYEVAGYEVEELELLTELEPFEVILDESFENNPALKSSRSSYEASKYQFKSARAQRYPTITAFGRVGSNYSSNGATNPSKPYRDPDTGESGYNFEPNATFIEQLGYNEFEYVNFSLNIPIFNRYQTSNNIQTAKVGMANAQLEVNRTVNQITNLIQRAYLDLVNAQNTYISAKENLAVTSQSFDFMTKRFETGNTDFYTYLESLNNKNRAEIQMINARYNIVFRKKILDLYRGN